MNRILNFVKNLLAVSSVLIFFTAICSAQNKTDLEVTTQAAAETARGGEKFSYMVTVKNVGQEKAANVMLFLESRQGETSAQTSAGSCGDGDEAGQNPGTIRCALGDLEPEVSVNIFFSTEIMHFDAPEPNNMAPIKNLPSSPSSINPEVLLQNERQEKPRGTVAEIRVYSELGEENLENNRTEVLAEMLPSKNKAPHIELISPKNNSVITKQVNKPLELKLTFKAFDPDGTIEKVVVDDPEYSWKIIEEDGQYKYWYDGKTFTAREFDEYFKTNKLKERLATKTGENTFTYVLRNPKFLGNRINVYAVDDGGRIGFSLVDFSVEADARLEIVSPKKEQVFAPNSTIKIETVSTINDPALSNLRLMGTRNMFTDNLSDLPILQQISKVGNTFKNQYIWKNIPEGVYRLEAVIINDLIPIKYSEQIKIVVAEPRIIKIASLKNGQEFEEDKPVMLRIEATDIKGKMVRDTLEIVLDGKTIGEGFNSWTTDSVPPFKQINDPARQYNLLNVRSLEKGVHTIQIIAKEAGWGPENKAILGQSEIITIKIK